MPNGKSQIQFINNPKGVKCMVYKEDCITKTHDSGLHDMCRDRKIVWVYPNKFQVERCPVHLVQKYLSLCPQNYVRKPNFYLQSLQKLTPSQWYGEQVVGQNTIAKVVQNLMKEAGIPGFFTNHSTRHTSGTRLFRAGVDRKLVKEATGHASDAVDKYQITSDQQREIMSDIIAKTPMKVMQNEETEKEITTESRPNKALLSISQRDKSCSCMKTEVNSGNVCEIVQEIIKQNTGNSKTTIKSEIEITKE